MNLTIVIPTYNRPKSTLSAIKSVLAQNCDCNIVVVDDYSDVPFNCEGEVAPDAPIIVVRHSENKGAAAARNTGLTHVTTEFVSFLDSDDALVEGTLDIRFSFAKSHLNRDGNGKFNAICCGWDDVDGAQNLVRSRTPNPSKGPLSFYSGCWFAPGSTLIMRTETILAKVGPFDEVLLRLEDLDWFIRFGELGSNILVDETIGARIQFRDTINVGNLKAASHYILDKYRGIDASKMNCLKAYLNMELSANAYRSGSYFQAVKLIVLSIYFKPRLHLHFSPKWKVNLTEQI